MIKNNRLIALKCLKNLSYIIRRSHTKIETSVSPNSSWKDWNSVIGLEIHAQLSTKSKLFSSAPSVYGAPTNTCVSLFDASIPGTLPVLNKEAVKLAVLSALAFGCKINPLSYFDRKHYFYSDLPTGYQITQQHAPIAENGILEFAIFEPRIHKNPYYKTCKIKQIQLEQDSGKSLHEHDIRQTFIDLNRAGIALIEIVFEPDLENGEEACALVKEVIAILERVGSCSCKMEEGALRVDANVSINRRGEDLGVRTEIKNIGTVQGINHAINYEIKRQLDLVKKGKEVTNETLTWDADLKETIIMRDKEEKQDYRFMPEPNLPPLRLLVDEYSESFHKNIKPKSFILNVRNLKNQIPDLPQNERIYLQKTFGLSDEYAYVLVNQNKLFRYFKSIMTENAARDPKTTYMTLLYNLMTILKQNNLELDDCEIRASHLGEIIDLLQTRRINKNTTNIVLQDLVDGKNKLTPTEIVEKKNLITISNPKELTKICLRVFEREEALVALYRRKKKKTVYQILMSKIIEESKFRADTRVLPKILLDLLEEMEEEK